MFVIIYFGQIELKFLEADGGSYCAEIFVNFTLVGGGGGPSQRWGCFWLFIAGED